MATPVGTIVCPACAGAVPKSATACPWCGSEVVLAAPKGADTPGEHKTYCTRCGNLYPAAAAKCPRCPPGSTDERGGRCPRCAGELQATAVGRVAIDVCVACKGRWFDGDELEHVLDMTTRGVSRAEAVAMRSSLPTAAPEPEIRYLACVRCGERMARRQAAPRSGLVIDICRNHGVWFDAGEFEQFEKFVRAGGLEVIRVDGVAVLEAERRRLEANRTAAGVATAYEDAVRARHGMYIDGLAGTSGPGLVADVVVAIARFFGASRF